MIPFYVPDSCGHLGIEAFAVLYSGNRENGKVTTYKIWSGLTSLTLGVDIFFLVGMSALVSLSCIASQNVDILTIFLDPSQMQSPPQNPDSGHRVRLLPAAVLSGQDLMARI